MRGDGETAGGEDRRADERNPAMSRRLAASGVMPTGMDVGVCLDPHGVGGAIPQSADVPHLTPFQRQHQPNLPSHHNPQPPMHPQHPSHPPLPMMAPPLAPQPPHHQHQTGHFAAPLPSDANKKMLKSRHKRRTGFGSDSFDYEAAQVRRLHSAYCDLQPCIDPVVSPHRRESLPIAHHMPRRHTTDGNFPLPTRHFPPSTGQFSFRFDGLRPFSCGRGAAEAPTVPARGCWRWRRRHRKLWWWQ